MKVLFGRYKVLKDNRHGASLNGTDHVLRVLLPFFHHRFERIVILHKNIT